MITKSNLLVHFASVSALGKSILSEFEKDIFENRFFLYKDTLLYDAEFLQFSDPKWENNTLKFCHDKYEEQYVFPLIHLANNIGSMFEFNSNNLKYIIAPKKETILKILNLPA